MCVSVCVCVRTSERQKVRERARARASERERERRKIYMYVCVYTPGAESASVEQEIVDSGDVFFGHFGRDRAWRA